MGLEIIGASFGRTGTLSVKHALEMLGFATCYHMADVIKQPEHTELWLRAWRGEDVWDELFAGCRATIDWPAAAFWRPLRRRYPQARVLLTLRDAESWHRSARNTIFKNLEECRNSEDPLRRARLRMADEIVRQGTFGGRLMDREHAIAVYEANLAAVRAEVPAEQLIEYSAGSGWEPLCRALNVPVPEADFPHVNTQSEFIERWQRHPDAQH